MHLVSFFGLLSLLGFLLSLSCQAAVSSPLYNVTTIAQFSLPTWVENLAIRSNGQIIATTVSVPNASEPYIYLIDPSSSQLPVEPVVLYSFAAENKSAVSGIAELGDDTFYIAAGDFSLSGATEPEGTFGIWKLVFAEEDTKPSAIGPTTPRVSVTKVAALPSAGLLNGLTVLDDLLGYILVADSEVGSVIRVNVFTGEYTTVLKEPSMLPTNDAVGINGLRVRDGYLYYTSVADFYRISINPDGTKAGNVATITNNAIGVDDFTFDLKGNVYMALNSQNKLGFLPNGEPPLSIVAGGSLATLPGPSSARLGRTLEDLSRGSIYLSTTDGQTQYIYQNWTTGGTISRIDVGLFSP